MTGLAIREREPSWPEIWANTRDHLRIELGQGVSTPGSRLYRCLMSADGHVRLSAPRRLVRDYTAQHYATRIERAFAAQTKAFASLEIVVSVVELRVTRAYPACRKRHQRACYARAARGGSNGGGGGIWDREPDAAELCEFRHRPGQ